MNCTVQKPICPKGMVAIIEDDLDIARILKMWLHFHHIETKHYLSAEAFMKALEQETDHFNICVREHSHFCFPLLGAIIDIQLPRMTGIQLAQTLRTYSFEFPLVLTTALSDKERINRYGELPESIKCFRKPFDLNELAMFFLPLLKIPAFI